MKQIQPINKTNSTNKLSRFFSTLINKLWLTLATIIILIALIFATLRILLPQINYFKSDIENWIETQYQVDIDISDIEATWENTGPVLSANNFQLNSNSEKLSLVDIESFSIHLDLFKSFLTKSIVTEKIDVYGANLNFVLDRKLGIRLDTIKDSKQQQVNVDDATRLLLSGFFAQKKLSLKHSTISIVTLSHEQFNYSIDEFSIRNFGDVHQLIGELVDEHQGKIKVVAEINGDPSLKENSASVYLEAIDIQIDKLPLFDNLTHLKPVSGDLNWRMWAEWVDGHWQSAVGNLEVDGVQWQKSVTSQEINNPIETIEQQEKINSQKIDVAHIEHFISQFDWRFENENKGLFSLYDVSLIRNDKENVILPNIYLAFNQSENFDLHWDLITHDFQVKPLIEYMDVLFANTDTPANIFQNSKLELNFDSLGIRFNKKNGVWYLPEVSAEFSQLAYQDLFDLPKLNGLSGQLDFANNKGNAEFLGENIQTDFNQLFRNNLHLNSLEIDVNWFINDESTVDLSFDKIYIKNNDLTLIAKGHFYIQDDKPVLSLYSELHNVDVSKKSDYLPVTVMSESLVNYLDTSIKSGELSFVKSVLHGPLESFPYDNQEGLFSILAQLNNAKYQFLPDWPLAESLNVELAFEGNGMDLKANSGFSKNNQVNYARAVIKDFGANNTPLELDLEVDSSNNSGRDFLLNSPLKSIGESLQILDYSGNLTTELNLTVGLDDPSNLQIKGKVIPIKYQSKINLVGMSLTDIDGAVDFTHEGMKKSKLSAKYYGLPLKANLMGNDNNKNADLLIDINGRLSAKSLQDFVGKGWASYAKGNAKFTSVIQVGGNGHQDHTLVTFDSDLVGIEINLPDEFHKLTETNQPIHLDLNIDNISTATIEWNNLKGQWQWQNNPNDPNEIQTLSGIFQYNNDEPLAAMKPFSFIVDANLKELNLNTWLSVYDTAYEEYLGSTSNLLKNTDINLMINKLNLNDITLNDLDLNISKKTNTNWLFDFKNNILVGKLEMFSAEPWRLNLDKLLYNPVEKKKAEIETENTNQQKIEIIAEESESSYFEIAKNWPDIVLSCKSCEVFNKQLGQVKANLKTSNNGLNIKGKLIDGKRHQVDFNLDWLQTDSDLNDPKSDKTAIEYHLRSNNIGKLMERWQYPAGIEDSSGLVIGKVSWLNKPWLPEILTLDAAANFEIGKGNLSDVSDAKARLFSLFNLQSIGRRLTLDFKDIFKKGFFYDKITGDAVLKNQVVSTNNIFIDGNAAKVDLVGEINLENEIIEQMAIVTPQITSSLPVLVGWAVEPTTGLLVYLLNKIMEPAIDVVTQVEYRIHGSLADIKVDEISKKNAKVKVELPVETESFKDESVEEKSVEGNPVEGNPVEDKSVIEQ